MLYCRGGLLDVGAGLSDRYEGQLPHTAFQNLRVINHESCDAGIRRLEVELRVHFDPFESPYRIDSTVDEPNQAESAAPLPSDLRAWLAEQERRLVVRALELNRYHQGRAAEALGLTYHQLRGCLRKHGLSARAPGAEAD